MNAMSAANYMLNSMVPISRFNKGEASKIFDEVNKSGVKVVVKNNAPTGVIISTEKYKELMEELENYHLLLEAEKREKNFNGNLTSHDDFMKELGLTEDDLHDVKVNIE